MEKLVYLVWGGGTPRSGDRLRDRLLGDTAGRVLAAGARGLTVNVHDGAAAEAPSPVPTPDGEDPHVAELSVWVDSYDRRDPVDEVVALSHPSGHGGVQPGEAAHHVPQVLGGLHERLHVAEQPVGTS